MVDREELLRLAPELRDEVLRSLDPRLAARILHTWSFWARDEQIAPSGDWSHWLILAGRGWGKTRTGAEWIKGRVASGRAKLIHLVGRTPTEARRVMIEGESGLLSVYAEDDPLRPTWYPGNKELVWPNGAKALVFSSKNPDALRGPQCDTYWADEPAAWYCPTETWDNLMFGFRLGSDPRGVATTTPRPIEIIRELVADEFCHVTRGTTYENIENLAPTFARKILSKYEGTRLGRQELMAELLDDVPGALWTRARLDEKRVAWTEVPPLGRIVVGVDPAVTSGPDASETGIVVVGRGIEDGHSYTLADYSDRYSPDAWARKVAQAFDEWDADLVVGEVNNGGDLVESNLRTVATRIPYKSVRATRGKHKRAEPIAALMEQGRDHHVGVFSKMEDQLCTWVPELESRSDSPDRMDAKVWATTELMLKPGRPKARASIASRGSRKG